MTFRLKFSITKGWHFLFRSKYLLIVTIFISGSKYYEHSSTIYTTVHHPPPILANLSPNDKHQWMLSYWVVVNTLYKSTLSTLNDALIQDIHAWNLVAPLSPCFSEFKLTLLLCQFLISADVSFIFFFFFFGPYFHYCHWLIFFGLFSSRYRLMADWSQPIFVVGADFCGFLLKWLPYHHLAVRQCDFQAGKIGKKGWLQIMTNRKFAA